MSTPIRQNIANLNDDERSSLVEAILELGRKKFADGVSYWFKQDQIHHGMEHVHMFPDFLPWHRELLNKFETMLQEVDPSVALHYWDWTTDPRSTPDASGNAVNLFTEKCFGSSHGPAGKPFAGVLDNGGVLAGSRDEQPFPGDPVRPPRGITRAMAQGTPPVDSDFRIVHVSDHLPESEQWITFRRTLEGSPNHNIIHGWVGGTMGPPHSAFEEPFVFMMHSNIDRLWAMWQTQSGFEWRLDPGRVYGSETAHPRITRPMEPWAGGTGIRPWAAPENLIEVKSARHPTVVVPPQYDTMP
tara:strand:- start:654 stop:1553 length:900 start_codon:yes stop_codon:yes gene_type:complete